MSAARRIPLITLILAAPLTVLACGDNARPTPATTTATVGATAGVNAPAASPAADRAAVAPIVVTFADGDSAYQSGRYADATKLFTAYGERHPDNAGAQYMIGLASWKAGDLKAADSAFDRALTLDPRHEKALLNSSRVLIELGRFDEAMDRLNDVLAIDSSSAVARRLQARVLEQQGDTDGAIDAYQQALLADEGDVWAMNNLGVIYIQQGRAEDALPPLARAVELRSTSPVFQNNLGTALEQTHHFDRVDAYAAALAADSGYTKAATSLARVRDRVDANGSGPANLVELAQGFQLQVRMLKDSARIVEPDSSAVNEPQR